MEFKYTLLCLFLIFVNEYKNVECKFTMEQKLINLRQQMTKDGCHAVIIPSEDEHQSEYVSKYDERRTWISDFTGSAGTAVVTMNKAALWTDSRYFIQGEQQLDPKYWILMKSGLAGVPRISKWLAEELQKGDTVCQSAKFTSIDDWEDREESLEDEGLLFVSPNQDLIDAVWPQDERPPKPNSNIMIHDIKYTGKTWQEKVVLVQQKIKDASADLFVVTALDDVAWLFNMRASDIPYNPMFFAYAVINADNTPNRLYIDQSRLDQRLRQHLNGIEFRDYDKITDDIKEFSIQQKKIWISPFSSYAIYNAVQDKNLLIKGKASPVRDIKAVKNDVELKNFRECQIRDSAARIRHMHWLETEMSKGSVITEMTAADKLEEIQAEDPLFKMLSFDSIAAVGANAAIVHYSTLEGDNSTLTKNKIFLLDAGAQYEDCTSDITRTHHYGSPTLKEKFAYTRVLQGSIELANIVFPENQIYGSQLDYESRSALWRSGLDYGHGTGHGIGYFLSVHEDPPSISYGYPTKYDAMLVAGMISSDEPGYYEDGSFGIRLETDIETVVMNTPYNFRGRKTLKFDTLTLVPFDKNLIDYCALTNDQVDWLNDYNKKIREKVGPRLAKYPEVQTYLNKITEAFKYAETYSECTYANARNLNLLNQNSASAYSSRVYLIAFSFILAIIFNL